AAAARFYRPTAASVQGAGASNFLRRTAQELHIMTQNPMIADVSEAKAFLDAHPDMQFFEIIYTGLSGVPRGKRLRRHELIPLYENGRFLPSSMLITEIPGQDVEQTGLIWQGGDADKIGRPIPGRLAMAPWLGPDI